jgi:hypothetical protein
MMWNNVPHCIFFRPLDHGVMDCIFVMTCCDKITCHKQKKLMFKKKNCQQKGFTRFAMMYMFLTTFVRSMLMHTSIKD